MTTMTTASNGTQISAWTAMRDARIAAVDLATVKVQTLPATHAKVPARISFGKVRKQKSFHDEGMYMYSAVVLIDGKRVGDAVDEGHGGGIWLNQDTHEAQKAYESVEAEYHALARATDPTAELSSEGMLNDFIEEYDITKVLNAQFKKGVKCAVLKGLDTLRETVEIAPGVTYEQPTWLITSAPYATVAVAAEKFRAAGITHAWNGACWAAI